MPTTLRRTETVSPQSPTCVEPAQPLAQPKSRSSATPTPTGQIDTWTQELGLAGNDATTSIWDIDYDPLYQLKDVKVTAPDGALRSSYSYGYDEAGNRIRETVDTATTTARHNSRNEIFETGGGTRTMVEGTINRPATVTVNGQSARLKPLSGGMEYLFQKEIPVAEGENEIEVTATDPAGAATTENYTFDVAGVQYAVTHDDNGNITRKRNIETGQVWIYEWDSLNRLLAIQSHELPEWESTRSEFTYDGQSRRVSRKEQVWRGAWEVDSENKYLWVGSKIAQKRSADGGVVEASYTGFGEERIDENGAKKDYYYTRDHLGSVREVVDDSGALKARYSYDPWGRRSKIEGEEDFEVEFGYTGHHFHEESKLHLTWYRAYDAGLGRWLSPDPIGENGGLNLYGYCLNDPVNCLDPDGLIIKIVGSPEYKRDITQRLRNIRKGLIDGGGCDIVKDLMKSDHIHVISSGEKPMNFSDGPGSWSEFDPGTTDGFHGFSPNSVLAHELQHAWDKDRGVISRDINPRSRVKIAEERAVRTGNAYRRGVGEEQRRTYGGRLVENYGGKPCPDPPYMRPDELMFE